MLTWRPVPYHACACVGANHSLGMALRQKKTPNIYSDPVKGLGGFRNQGDLCQFFLIFAANSLCHVPAGAEWSLAHRKAKKERQRTPVPHKLCCKKSWWLISSKPLTPAAIILSNNENINDSNNNKRNTCEYASSGCQLRNFKL